MDEIISEKTITSDEEIYFEDANFDKEWEDIINPDESVSQISQASSETSSLIAGNSVWNHFDKNPPHARGFNVCKKCLCRYKLSTSVSTLRKYLEKHQLKIPSKKHIIIVKKNPFEKEEQKEHDEHLVQ